MYTSVINQIKSIWKHDGFQKYFKNTGWMFASKILSMGISFIATIFVIRRLGPENFGQLSYAISFISIFSFIASLGIENILYRELINNPNKKSEFLGSAITIRLFAGLIAMILTIIFGISFSENDVSKLLIFILSGTFIFSAFQLITLEFQAQVKSKYPSIITLLITLILNLLKIIVVLSHKGVIYLALILLLEPILYAIFYWFIYEKKLGEKISHLRFDKSVAIILLKDSWPLIFTSAFTLVYARIDQVLIKHMLDAKAVGIYSSAINIAEVWYFLPGIIVASLFPAILNAKKTSEKNYYNRLKQISLFLLILAILISLIVTILAPFIIKIIYGSAFISGSIILKIYVWATIGTFLVYLANHYLIAENNKKGLVYMTFIPMIINIILNILWIPKFGIVGSAYATLISYSCAPLSLLLFKKTREDIKKIFIN